ncbi:hypothetical protein VTO73DRAFT_13692 [Trametes versicolor]
MQYRIENPIYGWYNWGRGLAGCLTIARAIHLAVVPAGTLKIGEQSLHDRRFPPHSDNAVTSPSDLQKYLPPCIYDALEVGLTVRGLGWQFAEGAYVPRPRRSSERSAYLKQTSLTVLRTFFFADLCDSFIELLPGVTIDGGSIFLPMLPPVPRYLLSTAIQFIVGIFIILTLEMVYDIFSLIGVGLLNQPPALWPPVHDKPWHMSSLHEFWSKRWHQILRSVFLVMGGYPGRWIAGDVGMLFGTFLASGLYHEVSLCMGGAPFDMRVLVFFVAQAFGILVEKVFRRITGKRVGGWTGWLWGAIFLLGIGQLCTDAWVARGGGGRPMWPPAWSPARRLLIPALRGIAAGL